MRLTVNGVEIPLDQSPARRLSVVLEVDEPGEDTGPITVHVKGGALTVYGCAPDEAAVTVRHDKQLILVGCLPAHGLATCYGGDVADEPVTVSSPGE